jgi:type IV secretory pathway VirB9-like protein
MKTFMQDLLVSTVLLVASVDGFAAREPHPLQPSAPRTVFVSDSQAPPVVRTGLLQATLVLLPNEEKVATVFVGDTVNWVFDAGHIASRYISVKPKLAGSITDLHIVSDHGNDYTIQLKEVSNEEDSRFDSKVFLTPIDPKAQSKLLELPVFVPASELEKAKQEIAAAKAEGEIAKRQQAMATEQYHSAYPALLHFDYVWDLNKGKSLGLQQIWRDDKFTYLQGRFQETPALYELKDNKGSLINFDFKDGLYTVPKELDNGYLAIGKARVDFHRAGRN